MSSKFFLTTPLYYVNAEPHIGSAYTTIAADAICRFWSLYGKEVCLLTGVDEHGGKIEATALARGISPQEHCDEISLKFQELWKKLNINYQKFSRTSSAKHNKLVQTFFERVKAKGDIYQAEYKGLYCLACEDFKGERELLEGKLCPIHHTPVQEYSESNYFFALSKYAEKLKAFFKNNPSFVQPKFRLNEIETWIDEGLKDFPISRRSVKWGIPVPGDESQTIYVWFDALLGYLSPFYEDVDLTDENVNKLFAQLPSFWPANLHLIGKDILRFHAVYWIAMLMSADLPLPQGLFGHGFLTKDGEKMGKTRGNIIVPDELLERFGIDAVRFYFLFNIPFGQDGDYSDGSFKETVNAYLANRLGNLFSRVLKLCETNLGGQIPANLKLDENSKIAQISLALPEKVKKHIESYELHAALGAIFEVVDALNLNLTEIKPWNLFKLEDAESRKLATVSLIETLESLRIVSNLLVPFMPNLSERMLEVFGLQQTNSWAEIKKWNFLLSEQKLSSPGVLFSRIE
jgi:methionyl-tRNA synthetase